MFSLWNATYHGKDEGEAAGSRRDPTGRPDGPVTSVQPFACETEALALANDVTQGLCASVWTTDHGRAERMYRSLDFGAVSVDTHAPMTAEMPHGGFGGSGYGKDLSMYGLEDYTRIKHVASAW